MSETLERMIRERGEAHEKKIAELLIEATRDRFDLVVDGRTGEPTALTPKPTHDPEQLRAALAFYGAFGAYTGRVVLGVAAPESEAIEPVMDTGQIALAALRGEGVPDWLLEAYQRGIDEMLDLRKQQRADGYDTVEDPFFLDEPEEP